MGVKEILIELGIIRYIFHSPGSRSRLGDANLTVSGELEVMLSLEGGPHQVPISSPTGISSPADNNRASNRDSPSTIGGNAITEVTTASGLPLQLHRAPTRRSTLPNIQDALRMQQVAMTGEAKSPTNALDLGKASPSMGLGATGTLPMIGLRRG